MEPDPGTRNKLWSGGGDHLFPDSGRRNKKEPLDVQDTETKQNARPLFWGPLLL